MIPNKQKLKTIFTTKIKTKDFESTPKMKLKRKTIMEPKSIELQQLALRKSPTNREGSKDSIESSEVDSESLSFKF